MKRTIRMAACVVVIVAWALGGSMTQAQTNSAASGNWNSAGTWTAGVPDDATPAHVDGGHTITVDSSAITNILDVGNAAGSSGTINVTPGAELVITDSDTVTLPNLPSIRLGAVAGTTGTMNVSGGTVFIDGPSNSGFAVADLLVGDNGDGNLTITDGVVQAADEIVIGTQPTSTGTVTVSGGTIESLGRSLVQGFDGTANLNVSGTAFVRANFDHLMGFRENSEANLTQSGGTIEAGFLFTNSFTAGAGSTVNINMTGGTYTARIAYVLGQGVGTTTVNHSGGLIQGTGGSSAFVVGDGGGNTSTYNMSGTATSTYTGELIVATFQNSTGTVNQTGGTMNVGTNAAIGRDGSGTYNISAGTFNAPNVFLGDFDSSFGTMRISGGDINVANSFNVGGALASNAAPDRVEPTGSNGPQGQALDANGTLIVSGSTSTIDIGGNFRANPADKSDFRSEPFIAGADNSATLNFEIFNATGTSLIKVAGIADLDGAVIDLDLMGGYVPTANATFDLLRADTFGATGSGTTENVGTGKGFSLAAEDASSFTLAVVTSGSFEILRASFVGSVGIPGDFDNDGDVDGRDFLAWQRNPSLGSLADWKTNYGTGSLAAVSVIPEPSSLALLSVVGVLAGIRRSQRTLDTETT